MGCGLTVGVVGYDGGLWVQGLHVAAQQRRAFIGRNLVLRACVYTRACSSWVVSDGYGSTLQGVRARTALRALCLHVRKGLWVDGLCVVAFRYRGTV